MQAPRQSQQAQADGCTLADLRSGNACSEPSRCGCKEAAAAAASEAGLAELASPPARGCCSAAEAVQQDGAQAAQGETAETAVACM